MSTRDGTTRISDLGLKIEGTALEPVVAEFRRELDAVGIVKVRPHFFLTTDWVVPDETVAIGIPFYLADADLAAMHLEREGHIEGDGRAELLRYLRHEMGHVVNYAYELFGRDEWTKLFGSMDQPYEDEYRPEPFSRRFVVHLPGWYAQKHPDEDWAETFAVWMTPGLDWRASYAGWPGALAKLEYCDAVMHELRDRDPTVTATENEWDVAHVTDSLDELYRSWAFLGEELPTIDGAVRTIFERLGDGTESARAADLVRKCGREITADVFRWTGHFPERTRDLLRHIAERADALGLTYPAEREVSAVIALSTLVASLAMNHIHRGSYASGL